MKRLSTFAILCFVALNAVNLHAQFRGGGGGAIRGGGGGGARPAAPAGSNRVAPAPAPVRPVGPVVHAPSTFTGRPQFNGGGGIHVRGPFGGRGVGVGVVVPSYGFGYPGFGYYDPFLYAGPYAPTYPSYGEQYPASNYLSVQQGPSYESNQVNELTSEVQELRDEIYSLRQSFPQVYNAPPFEQPAASSRVALPTILVFRDGHQVEAQGYAVVGQSIWVLTEQTSSRMLLSDLDVEATQRLNAARGVRFLLPRTN